MTEQKNIAIVTGATGAIGEAIARGLAEHPNTEVTIVARNQPKAEKTVERIRHATGNPHVDYLLADLGRKSEIYALAESWDKPLHILINNAATSPRQRQETPEGIEVQWAVNVLSYFWMSESFKDILAKSAPARIVNVASYWAGDLDLDDVEFKRRSYLNGTAYRQSKQANRMLTVAFAEMLKPMRISVNACHPGDVSSTLSHDLGFGGSETPEQGAATPLWLATDNVGIDNAGKYFEHLRESRDRFSNDRQAIEHLFSLCQGYHGE
jgi:NAD(P)-dependent dehydrogenase (short-subunit alcohol dehydrogenase family)